MDLSVESTVTDDHIVVFAISGAMDVETTPAIRDSLVRHIDEGHHRLVLELSDVDFIDSIGLGLIVGMVHRLRPHEGSLAVAAPSPQVRNVLQITQLGRIVTSYESAEAAVSDIRDGGGVVSATRRPA